MEKYEIFRDVAERTGGDIYLGVVGPVRTGKSTFIKRFMDLLVIPNIKNPNERDRANDELPQSGAGKTITTTEPKFVPDEAVEIEIKEGLKIKVRLVDCVGYIVDGAIGYEEEDGARMVNTPWSEEEMPFQQAAEIDKSTLHVTIGGQPAEVQFAGITIAGVWQLNVKVPDGLPDGDAPVVAEMNGLRTQDGAFVSVKK
jgi:stage IV sporulation protein A